MNLYVFSSTSEENVKIAWAAGLWAAPVPGAGFASSVRAKARLLTAGERGVFYCSQTKALTVPFEVTTSVDLDRTITGVWSGTWALSFGIKPLGPPSQSMTRDFAMSVLPIARASGKRNMSHVLHLTPAQVFTPTTVSNEDWVALMKHLGDR